jgi:thiol-disulfide isomerase/thioredoxin
MEAVTHFETVASLEKAIGELAPGHVLVVKLGATWCKPCKKVEPDFKALAASNEWTAAYGSVDLSEMDEEPPLEALKDFCGCEKVPHFAFYKDGSRVEGMQTSDIATVRSALVRLANPVMVIDDDDLDF